MVFTNKKHQAVFSSAFDGPMHKTTLNEFKNQMNFLSNQLNFINSHKIQKYYFINFVQYLKPMKQTDNLKQSLSNDQENQVHYQGEEHIKAGEFVKSAVYGGLDGLITTLSIVLSGIGLSNIQSSHVVALGLASLIADGISMAVADYLATKSDDEYMKSEEKRQMKQIQTDFEAEKQEMVTIYENMGLKPQVSQEIVDILSRNKEGFLSVMMIEQLHLIPDQENPFKNSIVTFLSFCIFGLMPLIPFLIASANDLKVDYKYTIATISISFFFLFVLGFGKSFVTSATWYYSSAETIFIGAISAGAAFGIGTLFGASQ